MKLLIIYAYIYAYQGRIQDFEQGGVQRPTSRLDFLGGGEGEEGERSEPMQLGVSGGAVSPPRKFFDTMPVPGAF